MPLKGEIIAIGDELVSGRELNTTSSFAAARLFDAGHEIRYMTVIGDEPSDIKGALHLALQRSSYIIVSGGLGPTSDDITNEAVAAALGLELQEDGQVADTIRRMEHEYNTSFSEEFTRKLTMLPAGAMVLNPHGTAAGYELVHDGVHLFFLPGVPEQLREHLVERVIPRLNQLDPMRKKIRQKIFKLFGLTETQVNERLQDLPDLDQGIRLGYYPVFPEVHLSITVKGEDSPHVNQVFDAAVDRVESEFHNEIIATDSGSLEATVGNLLRKRGVMLAVAESCTGGLVGKRLTDVPGSSSWFERGFITYSNSAKMELLGVSMDTLQQYGAVSSEAATEMVQGAAMRSRAQSAIAITGIAGPGGGSAEKPVGTVFIALLVGDDLMVHRFLFHGSRDEIRAITSETALDWLRRYLAYGSKLPGYRPES